MQLWARDAEKIRLDGRTGLLALVLFATCATLLLHGFGRTAKGLNAHWLTGLMLLVGCAAFPAAVALREQRAAPLRRAFGWIALALVIRVGWRVAWAPTWGGPVTFPLGKLPDFFSDLICEAVAFFLVDEVAFAARSIRISRQ